MLDWAVLAFPKFNGVALSSSPPMAVIERVLPCTTDEHTYGAWY